MNILMLSDDEAIMGAASAAANETRGTLLAEHLEMATSLWGRFMGLMGRAGLPAARLRPGPRLNVPRPYMPFASGALMTRAGLLALASRNATAPSAPAEMKSPTATSPATRTCTKPITAIRTSSPLSAGAFTSVGSLSRSASGFIT